MKYTLSFNSNSPSFEYAYIKGLTESQLIQTMLEHGVHRVATIAHDRKGCAGLRPLSQREMISIWKKVYLRIKD